MVVAFNTVGAVSISPTHEILSSVFSIPLETGTIKNMVMRCVELLKDAYERICLTMISLGLLHCDETDSRVDGKTCWVHVASDQNYTYLTINQKRGQIGMDAANVFPHARGIIVHDCWGFHWKYQDVAHVICCAHLLRELNGVIENHPEQTWVARFKKLLPDMKKVQEKALFSDKDEVSYYHRHKQEYLTIMSYIGSVRKHGINIFTAIREALNGNPDIIFN